MASTSRASSSVIGTILLVAITVVIGTTVAAYGIGFSDTSRKPMQATLDGGQDGLAGDKETNAQIQYTVEAGDSIDADQIQVLIDGTPASDVGVPVTFSADTLSAGDTITIKQNDGSDLIGTEDIRIVYESPDTDETKLLETVRVETGGPAYQVSEFTFESTPTGDSPGTPWSTTTEFGSKVQVSDSRASEGSKSVYFQADESTTAKMSVDVDLTYVEELKFAHYPAGGEANDLKVRIDGTTVYTGNSGGWQTVSLDVSEYSGTHTVTFRVYEDTANAATSQYIDNVRFIHETGNLVSEDLLLP